MPSYPASVKTFTNKASGQNIDPTHVNDIQDEVNAIEAGLLNGTARLNSSGSTVTTLSVSGGSTFSVRPVAPPPDAALVFLQTTAALGSSNDSTLTWLSEDFVTNSSMHSTATNPDRLTPQSTGIYQFGVQLAIAGAGSSLSLNGALIIDSSGNTIGTHRGPLSTTTDRLQVVGFKRFDVTGGYALCRYVSDNVSTHSLTTGVQATWFCMAKL